MIYINIKDTRLLLVISFFTLQYWSLRETFWMDEKKTCHVYISAWCTALLYCAYEKLIITFWNNLALKCKNIKWSTFITWKKTTISCNLIFYIFWYFILYKLNVIYVTMLVLSCYKQVIVISSVNFLLIHDTCKCHNLCK